MSEQIQHPEYIMSGPDADQLASMAVFCSGPGIDGFLAWCEQRWPSIGADPGARQTIIQNAQKIALAFGEQAQAKPDS